VARYVPNYVAPANRTTLRAAATLPKDAKNPILILSASGMDVQDNAASPTTSQYWTKIPAHGSITLKGVVPGTYRVTIYADGVFGSYTKDNVTLALGRSSPFPVPVTWGDDPSAYEVWRIGNPDHSAGEFRHGYSKDTRHKLGLQEYRVFHGAYNFWRDFPDGVVYRIGTSTPERDWNYVHWSGGNSTWTVVWDMATVLPPEPGRAPPAQLADPRVAAPKGKPAPALEDSAPPPAGSGGGWSPPGSSPGSSSELSGANRPPRPPGAPMSPSGWIDSNPSGNSPASPLSWSTPNAPFKAPSSTQPFGVPKWPGNLPVAQQPSSFGGGNTDGDLGANPWDGEPQSGQGNRPGPSSTHPNVNNNGGNGAGSDVASSWLRSVNMPLTPGSAVDTVLSNKKLAGELDKNDADADADHVDSSSPRVKRRQKRQDMEDKTATLTVQAAGVRTAAGNEHVFGPGINMSTNKYANLDVTATLNGQPIGVWTIP
jgi:Polysaccharide lyase family 4, domain II/Polysaccharide lyase family 4, domain III